MLQGGMWVSFTYGFLAWLNCYWDRRPHAGIVVFAFFVVAGIGLRAGSFFSILSLFAFLEFTFVLCLVAFGWMFSSPWLDAAPLLLVGSLKAAWFLARERKPRAKSRWRALRPLPDIIVAFSALAACLAVLFGTVFSAYPM